MSPEHTAEATRAPVDAPPQIASVGPGPHLDLARTQAAMDSEFPQKSFVIHHNLKDHPLLSVEQLLLLSQRLPAKHVEYCSGEVGVQDHGKNPSNGLTPQETIRRIGECKSWLALRNIEADPTYRALVEACVAEVRAVIGNKLGPLSQPEGFVFLSSPGSVTPLHLDPEHNFLLQIRGSKLLHLWDPWNREVVTEEMLEEMHTTTDWSRQKVEDNGVPPTWSWTLEPGIGAYFPVEAPHWVQNGEEVSISFSFVFRSQYAFRKQSIHQMNAKLRRQGKSPKPVGQSALTDSVKAAVMRAGRIVKRAMGR